MARYEIELSDEHADLFRACPAFHHDPWSARRCALCTIGRQLPEPEKDAATYEPLEET